MNTRVTQLFEKFCTEKHSDSVHCDVSSSRIPMVNIPISIELFHELEAI